MAATVTITCPSCGRSQKTRAASEWCDCNANALWFRDRDSAHADVMRIVRAGDLAEVIPAPVGAWRA